MKKYRVKEGSPLEFMMFMAVVCILMATGIAIGSTTYLGG